MSEIIALALAALWLVTSLGFIVHMHGAPKDPQLKWRSYIKAWCWEFWCNFVSVVTYPLGWWPALKHLNFDSAGGPPIVLLPGYGMNRAYLFVLAWRLRKHGYRNVYPLNLSPLLGSIETMSLRLAKDLRRISHAAHGEKIVVIAHSMGGIVMRWGLQQEPDLPVCKLITLGSPHAGTRMAYLAFSRNGMQLRERSTFIRGLSQTFGVPVVSLYSRLDTVVVPAQSCRVEALGGVDVCFDHCSHNTLLFDRKVFASVLSSLPPLAYARGTDGCTARVSKRPML